MLSSRAVVAIKTAMSARKAAVSVKARSSWGARKLMSSSVMLAGNLSEARLRSWGLAAVGVSDKAAARHAVAEALHGMQSAGEAPARPASAIPTSSEPSRGSELAPWEQVLSD
jgi:hypothetical protein